MNKEKIKELYENEWVNDTNLSSDNFLIVHSTNVVKAMEKATGMDMNDIAQIITGREDKYDCWGYDDEYDTCTNCYKVIRTSPDSYAWTPQYSWIGDCEKWCADCIREHKDEYIDELLNNDSKANTILTTKELTDMGFTRLDENYESGWHPHQNDNPKEILRKLQDKYKDVIFSITDKGQFDVHYTCFVRGEIVESDCKDEEYVEA